MFVVKHRIWFFTFSSILVLASIAAIIIFGLNLGTDFKGGSVLEVNYPEGRPAVTEIEKSVSSLNLGKVSIQPTGQNAYTLRTSTITESQRALLVKDLTASGTKKVEQISFSSIGPIIGQEIARRGVIALVLSVILIVLFISFAFRKVSSQLSSWKYGIIAVVALLHDVMIPTGVAAILGHYRGFEVDSLFLSAVLTIFALSVNDTIVIFDRIRENVRARSEKTFEDTVGRSLSETYVRSFNTSATVVLVLLALYAFGSASTHNFSLILVIGMIVGTYSSIFLAAPLLVVLERLAHRKK